MTGFLAGRAEAVPRPFVARVPSCKFQDARRTPWRLTAKFAHAVGPVYPISCCTSPLLPAPGAASFSTTTGADLGHLRHLATRLVQLSASKAGLSGAALVDALAGYKDQLDTLRIRAGPGSKECFKCGEICELYCFPADRGSPDGRFHYCFACKAEVRIQRNAPVGESIIPTGGPFKSCILCGELRPPAWYSFEKANPSGRAAKCRPCRTHIDQLVKEKHQHERESQDAVTEKLCRGCEKTLPANSFAKYAASKDGLQHRCRECSHLLKIATNAKLLERSKNQILVLAVGTEQVCLQCNVKKSWGDFRIDLHRVSGIESKCKECLNKNVSDKKPKRSRG